MTLQQRKGRRAQKQKAITDFLKTTSFNLQIFIILGTIFVCGIISFDAVLYFFVI
jgi:hypothetical protein